MISSVVRFKPQQWWAQSTSLLRDLFCGFRGKLIHNRFQPIVLKLRRKRASESQRLRFMVRRGRWLRGLPVRVCKSVFSLKRLKCFSVCWGCFVAVVVAENDRHLGLRFFRVCKFRLGWFVARQFTSQHVDLSRRLDSKPNCVSLHFDNSNFYIVTNDNFLVLLPW